MTVALDRIKHLKDELAKAEAAAATEIAAGKQTIMAEIFAHMKDNEVSLLEMSMYARTSQSKYCHGTDTWSGKGKKPGWILKAVAAGKSLDDFLVVKPEAAAE